MTAADWQAIAEWVTAATVLAGVAFWLWQRTWPLGIRFAGRLRKAVRSVLRSEVTAGAAWASVSETPEVSMKAGIAFARTAAAPGHPPYTPTSGRPDPEQPLDYLLAKTAEIFWAAVSAAHSELGPYLVPGGNSDRARREGGPVPGARLRPRRAHRARPPGGRDWADQGDDPGCRRTSHGTGLATCACWNASTKWRRPATAPG